MSNLLEERSDGSSDSSSDTDSDDDDMVMETRQGMTITMPAKLVSWT